jgi:hypothetical protein
MNGTVNRGLLARPAVSLLTSPTLTVGGGVEQITYDDISFSVSSQANSPSSVTFNDSGLKMFILATNGDRVHQYTLSTAFNVSTASYSNIELNVGSQEYQPQGIDFGNNGLVLYVVGSGSDNFVE